TTERWQTAEDYTRFRRGLYVYLRRTAPYPTWSLFDGPARDVSCARRSVTNTPLQALALWNDPAFVEAAGGLAARAAREASAGEERLARMFRLCLARRPTDRDLRELAALLDAARASFATSRERAEALLAHARVYLPPPEQTQELAALTVVANTLLALDERITLP